MSHPVRAEDCALWADSEQLFSSLHHEFGFTLDAYYRGRAIDRPRSFRCYGEGLLKSWQGERVFVAIPPGCVVEPWLRKAHAESKDCAALVVCVTVASPDADWWEWWSSNASEIRFPRGRVSFQCTSEALVWPVAIFIFRPRNQH